MLKQQEISQVDIEELLEAYGLDFTVTSRGNANFCCPFHGEKNPSCGMHVETGLWKCFSCGEQGNLIQFIAKLEEITEEEAEQRIRKVFINKVPDTDSLVRIISTILDKDKFKNKVDPVFPDWMLSQYTKDWTYMKSRGFTDETLEHFNVVYDPINHLQGFPCYNLERKLVGVSGRFTDGNPQRYNPVIRFRKSNFLYNAYRVDVSKPVIAVEGEINCIAMHQHGFPNTVAFLGAGVTQNQIDLIKWLGISELILFFDSDDAGNKGSRKIFIALWNRMKIKIVPDHTGDPAEMKTDEVTKLIKEADYFEIS